MKRTVRAEMTVFLSLTLLLVASLLFALLEAARFYGLKADADMDSMLETESAFADYNVNLLKDYKLLYLDDSYGSGEEDTDRVVSRILELSEANLNPQSVVGGSDFYRMRLADCSLKAYEVATDHGGDAFREQAVDYQKGAMAQELLEQVYSRIVEGKAVEENGTYSDSMVTDAGTAIETAKQEEAARRAEGKEKEIPPPPDIEFENPLECFSSMKQSAILTLVLPQDAELSSKVTKLDDVIEKRTLYTGNYERQNGTGILDNILFYEYLSNQAGRFGEVKENHKLDYEMEYIIGGKESDRENLEAVVNRILLIREMANLMYLHTDAEKMGTAQTIATVLAGVTANPAIIFAVKEGILAAWAYVESIQDLRTLLAGGKIPLVKTNADWTTDVLHPATSNSTVQGAKENDIGFSYQDYLFQFLFFMNQRTVNYRAMDMIEQTMRLKEQDADFRMDCMIQRAVFQYTYEADPFFWKFVFIGDDLAGKYRFQEERTISYIE